MAKVVELHIVSKETIDGESKLNLNLDKKKMIFYLKDFGILNKGNKILYNFCARY